jgi:hypothetical protein
MEIEASPYGQIAITLGQGERAGFDGPDVVVRPGAGRPAAPPPPWARDLTRFVKRFNEFWGAGDGVKAAAGGNGHQVVLKVGHVFGKKFKPWEAARAANQIGKAAKVGGVFFAVGVEVYGVFADERAAVKAERARAERRRSITHEILAQADGIAANALRGVRQELDDLFRPEYGRIDAVTRDIRGAQSARSDLRDRLVSVQQRAESALGVLSGPDGPLADA